MELRSSRGLLVSGAVWQVTPSGAVPEDDGGGGGPRVAVPTTTTSGGDDDGEMVREVVLMLPETPALAILTLELTVLAMLGPQRDTNAVDHIVSQTISFLQFYVVTYEL